MVTYAIILYLNYSSVYFHSDWEIYNNNSHVTCPSVILGYHDEHLPSVYGRWTNGEEVRWQHKKGWLFQNKNILNISHNKPDS